MNKKIITRFAPSPTGFLHVGSLRTVLYNYLFAQKNQGKFFLRIEDTDQERKVAGAVENLKNILEQFKLIWDNKKIMVQSERIAIYQKFAQKLVEENKAYYCFCSKERLEQIRKVQQQKGLPPMYDGTCRSLTPEETEKKLKANQPAVIRFKIPKTGQTEFTDLIRGQVTFTNNLLDDQIILKSDGFPTYHLASVIDDHEMEISHVIRGEEWLSSTPKHIMLYQAFGWPAPEFAHLPLLLNPDRTKLSKRQGDVAVEDYLKKGYLPQALLNFVLLLGWNPGTDKEIFSLPDMILDFSLEKVHKAGAIFNLEKIDWLNSEYLKKIDFAKFKKSAIPYLNNNFSAIPKNIDLTSLLKMEQERIRYLAEIGEGVKFFFTNELIYESKILIWKKSDQKNTKKVLELLIAELKSYQKGDWQIEKLKTKIAKFIEDKKLTNGEVLWPMRVALTGQEKSPPPFDVAVILGKEETLNRLQKATNLLN